MQFMALGPAQDGAGRTPGRGEDNMEYKVLYQYGPCGDWHTWLRGITSPDEAVREATDCREALTRAAIAVWDIIVVRVELHA